MLNLDHSAQVTLVVVPFALLFTAAIVIVTLWMPHQAKLKAIDVLKAYAEKGEEPPASVLEAVERMNRLPAPPRQTRADHLAHLAGSLVLAIGLGVAAWWLASGEGGPAPLGHWGPLAMVLSGLGAIFFAGSAAARLMAAIVNRD
jgi:hypothetical protein